MSEQPTPNAVELAEAQRIVGRLAPSFDSMRPSDQRLWRTFRCYLIRKGSEARVGPHRLKMLRDLWRLYGAVACEMEKAA